MIFGFLFLFLAVGSTAGIEAWLSLVERCVREHRTVGVLCEAVGCELGSTVQCFGIFCQGKFGVENRLTTCLTTCTDLVGKIQYFLIIDAWLSLVERYVRDVEVACSNHVASTNKKRQFLIEGCRFLFIFSSKTKKFVAA